FQGFQIAGAHSFVDRGGVETDFGARAVGTKALDPPGGAAHQGVAASGVAHTDLDARNLGCIRLGDGLARAANALVDDGGGRGGVDFDRPGADDRDVCRSPGGRDCDQRLHVVDDLDLGGEVAIGTFLQFYRKLANADVIGARHVDVGGADPLDPDHLASANRHDAL